MSAVPAPLEAPAVPFDARAFQAATGASEAALADLEAFRALLEEWNGRMNLVGPSAMGEFWLRHAYDSAQLLALDPEALTWADLGSGAGFPGLVLAILLKGRPGVHVHLVESQAKRCRFLSHVVDQLSLPATVHNARAEDLSLKVDVVTARACAPLVRLLGYAWPYLKCGARAAFLKGQDVEVEVQEATRYWKFEAQLRPSLTHPQGRIVQVKRAYRVKSA
jgi:16S rRNA (guanine527-N7)-methyltransferase